MTSVHVLPPEEQVENNITAFAGPQIRTEPCDTGSPQSKPCKSSVAPIDIPDGKVPRAPRYLRDPSRRSSIQPIQPRKASAQIENVSLVIDNISASPYIGGETSTNNCELEKQEQESRGDTDSNVFSTEQSKRKINFKPNAVLKSDAHFRRSSVPVPPKLDKQCSPDRQRTRRASHAGYKGNPSRLYPHANYGMRSNSLSRKLDKQEQQELDIIISNVSQTKGKGECPVKFKIISNEPSFTSQSDVTIIANISGTENDQLPGMTNADRLVTGSAKSTGRTRRLTSDSGPYIPKPDNHIILSMFSCICCCPLVGLVALIFSCQVDSKYENGKKEVSVSKSHKARCWALSAVMLGMLTITVAVMYVIVVFVIVKKP